MTKKELASIVSEKVNLSKKDAEAAVNVVFDSIAQAMKEGDKVNIAGFGIFETKERSARTAKNPQTGETIEIAARKVPAVKFGKTVKDLVAE